MKVSQSFPIFANGSKAALLVRALSGLSLFSAWLAVPAQTYAPVHATTLQVENQPWFDVTAYGAKCDGSTDDTTAINAAIIAASNVGGGNVLIPWTGKPCVADGIMLKSFVALRGTHRRLVTTPPHSRIATQASLQHKTGGTHALIGLYADSTHGAAVQWGIYDLGIDGNVAGNSGQGLSEIDLNLNDNQDGGGLTTYVHRGTIMNVDVVNSSGNGIVLNQGGLSSGGQIDLISINSSYNTGDGFDIDVSDTYCVRCEASENGGNGFSIANAGSVHLTETKSWSNGQSGTGSGYNLYKAYGGLYTAIESQSNANGAGFYASDCNDLTVFGHFDDGDKSGVTLSNVSYSRFVGGIHQESGYGLIVDSASTNNIFDFTTDGNDGGSGGANLTGDVYLSGTLAPSNRIILNGILTQVTGTITETPAYSGTKTAGACNFNISGGIITSVTGC